MYMDGTNRRPLREFAYEELKQRVVTGQIGPGVRMMEIALANDLGVSRTPIREAMRKLEKEGLVTIEPHRGASASLLSPRDIINLLTVRARLEQLAAEQATQRMTPALIDQLRNIASSYEQSVQESDTGHIIKYDEAFHQAIVTATDNEILISFCRMAQDRALRFRYLYYDDFSRYKHMPSEHYHIIDAIKSGDSRRAGQVSFAHVNSLQDFVIKKLKPSSTPEKEQSRP